MSDSVREYRHHIQAVREKAYSVSYRPDPHDPSKTSLLVSTKATQFDLEKLWETWPGLPDSHPPPMPSTREADFILKGLNLLESELEKRYGPEPPGGETLPPEPDAHEEGHLIPEDAAILKVLQAGGTTMTVDLIEGRVTFSEKSIRERLKWLTKLGLAYEPEKKKGYTLTAKGKAETRELPADAGLKFIRPEMPGR